MITIAEMPGEKPALTVFGQPLSVQEANASAKHSVDLPTQSPDPSWISLYIGIILLAVICISLITWNVVKRNSNNDASNTNETFSGDGKTQIQWNIFQHQHYKAFSAVALLSIASIAIISFLVRSINAQFHDLVDLAGLSYLVLAVILILVPSINKIGKENVEFVPDYWLRSGLHAIEQAAKPPRPPGGGSGEPVIRDWRKSEQDLPESRFSNELLNMKQRTVQAIHVDGVTKPDPKSLDITSFLAYILAAEKTHQILPQNHVTLITYMLSIINLTEFANIRNKQSIDEISKTLDILLSSITISELTQPPFAASGRMSASLVDIDVLSRDSLRKVLRQCEAPENPEDDGGKAKTTM